jgi:uncharacterized protein (UPF0147 family)
MDNAIQTIENARTETQRANILFLTEVHPNNIRTLKKYRVELRMYGYGELLRQVHLLYNVFYNNNLPQEIRDSAADLLEQLLGIEPNSGLIVDIRAKIKIIDEQIQDIENIGTAAGGKSRRKKRTIKNRKSKSKKQHY